MSGPISEWAVSALGMHYICVLVVTLGMSGPISEWAVSASSVYYCALIIILMHAHGMSGPISAWVGCICLENTLYALIITHSITYSQSGLYTCIIFLESVSS